MTNPELKQYVLDRFGAEAEYLWRDLPDAFVFRHESNRKWFALVMDIPKAKLGIRDSGMIDIVNLKCDPLLVGSLRNESGFFPAYHMSKDKWISVALDGSVDDGQIKALLDISFELTDVKLKKRKKARTEHENRLQQASAEKSYEYQKV